MCIILENNKNQRFLHFFCLTRCVLKVDVDALLFIIDAMRIRDNTDLFIALHVLRVIAQFCISAILEWVLGLERLAARSQ